MAGKKGQSGGKRPNSGPKKKLDLVPANFRILVTQKAWLVKNGDQNKTIRDLIQNAMQKEPKRWRLDVANLGWSGFSAFREQIDTIGAEMIGYSHGECEVIISEQNLFSLLPDYKQRLLPLTGIEYILTIP